VGLPPLVPEDITKAVAADKPLPNAADGYLQALAERHPEWKAYIESMRKVNLTGDEPVA
jgi:hypothetical protein